MIKHRKNYAEDGTIKINKLTVWKGISAILAVLLIFSIYSGGFSFEKASKEEKTQPAQVAQSTQPSQPKVQQAITGTDVEGRSFKGAEDAKVTIVEYSSFSCGFCNSVRGTIDQILETYQDDVKIVYKHFNRGGTDSQTAQATECAGDQDKFWEMHDMIFDNGTSNLNGYAESLGLDVEEFNSCLSTNKYASRVDADSAEGRAAGVSGTPTFLINGQKLVGAQPFSAFKQIIDEALTE